MIIDKLRVILCLCFFFCKIGISQIQVLEKKEDAILIGKININNTDASSFLPPKIKVGNDGLSSVWDKQVNKHHQYRKDVNDYYNNLAKRGTLFFGDFAATLVLIQSKNSQILTFLNRSHDYQYESFWISEKSANQLYDFINQKLNENLKWTNYEVLIDSNIVLVLSFHKKKVSFGLYDHYKWYHSGWFKSSKIKNLFSKS